MLSAGLQRGCSFTIAALIRRWFQRMHTMRSNLDKQTGQPGTESRWIRQVLPGRAWLFALAVRLRHEEHAPRLFDTDGLPEAFKRAKINASHLQNDDLRRPIAIQQGIIRSLPPPDSIRRRLIGDLHRPIAVRKASFTDLHCPVAVGRHPIGIRQHPIDDRIGPMRIQHSPIGNRQLPVDGQHRQIDARRLQFDNSHDPILSRLDAIIGRLRPVESLHSSFVCGQEPVGRTNLQPEKRLKRFTHLQGSSFRQKGGYFNRAKASVSKYPARYGARAPLADNRLIAKLICEPGACRTLQSFSSVGWCGAFVCRLVFGHFGKGDCHGEFVSLRLSVPSC